MALIINLEQEQEDFLMEVLSHFKFIHSIKKTASLGEALTDEEKEIIDQRWAKYEEEGTEDAYTLDEVLQKINKKHGI